MTLPCIYWTAIHPNGQNTNYVSNGTRIRGRIFPEVVFACMPTALLLEPNKFRHCRKVLNELYQFPFKPVQTFQVIHKNLILLILTFSRGDEITKPGK